MTLPGREPGLTIGAAGFREDAGSITIHGRVNEKGNSDRQDCLQRKVQGVGENKLSDTHGGLSTSNTQGGGEISMKK